MLNRIRNIILIAALGAILGMAESCSASTLSPCRSHAHTHSHARRVAFAHSRVAKQLRVVMLRADSLHSPKTTITLHDAVEVPDDSEDDLGDEPRDALPRTSPDTSVVAFEYAGDTLQHETVLRVLVHEGGPPGSARPRFLSLCRLII